MFRRMMVKLGVYGLCCALTFTLAVPVALAGGFYIAVEAPTSSTDPQLKDAVVLVRPYGCHTPTDASLSATAEGLVDGRRQSIPLQLTLASTGVYAVKRQWPTEGVWVLAISGKYLNATSSALVELGPKGKVQWRFSGDGKNITARIEPRQFTREEIEASLHALAGKAAKNLQAAKTPN